MLDCVDQWEVNGHADGQNNQNQRPRGGGKKAYPRTPDWFFPHPNPDAIPSGEPRQPSENELAIARFQGRHVALIAQKLAR